jgi:hypothetical protein
MADTGLRRDAAWMVIGLGYLVCLYFARPRRVLDVGLMHISAEPAGALAARVAP